MIELIVGPMSAGKSTEMLRRVNRARIAGLKTIIIKPAIDSRAESAITTHDGALISCHTIQSSGELPALIECEKPQVIGIDELQFFDEDIVNVILEIDFKIKVIVTGLDLTWEGTPFENTMWLMPFAEKVKKLPAVCTMCGADASRSLRKSKATDTVLVGGLDLYTALCTPCWQTESTRIWRAGP
jgi:thymidine kinase